MFVESHYGTCFMSPFWRLEFWDSSKIVLKNLWTPDRKMYNKWNPKLVRNRVINVEQWCQLQRQNSSTLFNIISTVQTKEKEWCCGKCHWSWFQNKILYVFLILFSAVTSFAHFILSFAINTSFSTSSSIQQASSQCRHSTKSHLKNSAT